MYCFILLSLTFLRIQAASSGAKKCDALGLCTEPSSGAYQDPATGDIICPWGMHLVTPPERSDNYTVTTAPLGETGPTFYTPGQYMDIHITTVGSHYMKFLGILMYAVQYADVLGPEGCPSPGCDGKEEVKLGTWEVTNSMFQVSEPCNGQAVTHRNADPKPYRNVFRWKAPEAGSGDVIFRVVIKQGSTNMGHFWWPMTAGDLMLTEGPTESISEWFTGDVSMTCTEICGLEGRACDRSMPTGSLDFYHEHVGKTQSCQLPLLSTCSRTAPSRDEAGHCWLDNQDSGLCDRSQAVINVCDAVEVSGGSTRLCPCIPSDDDGWLAQSTSAPSAHPSVSPTSSLPTVSPTATNPTSAPSHWYDPRWVEVYNGRTSCSYQYIFARPCTGDNTCTYDQCQNFCAEKSRCKYFYFRQSRGWCQLFTSCDVTRDGNPGVTVFKDVVPTNEPSLEPTVSFPTGLPSVEPTKSPSKTPSFSPSTSPTISEPTAVPTISQPTELPSVSPSLVPTVSSPSAAPTYWYDPRWVEVFRGTTTCADQFKLRRVCKKGCSYDRCQDACAQDSRCKYFFYRSTGYCHLLNGCDTTRTASYGVTVRIDRIPTNEPSAEPTISAPTVVPTTSGPSEVPTVAPTSAPTVSSPSIAPTNWFAPRWVEVYRNATTCADRHRISRPCRGGSNSCSYAECKEFCAQNSRCRFFLYRSSRRYCQLMDSCDTTKQWHKAVTVRKDVIPTNEPSYAPTISMPTSSPTLSEPTEMPTISEPTKTPTVSQPTEIPTDAPSSSLPTKLPTTWDTPRWHIEFSQQSVTCGKSDRISVRCNRGCWGNTCRTACADREDCEYYFKSSRGRCELFRSCNARRNAGSNHVGTTWRKEMLTGPSIDG